MTLRSAPAPALHQPACRCRLSNGITLVTVQNPTVDIVAIRSFLHAGSCVDSADQAGLANLVSAVLTRGTSTQDAHAIAATIESLGASISSDVTTDYFEVSLKCVAHDYADVLCLARDLLRDPIFPEHEVNREQTLMLQGIQSHQERPFSLAFDKLRQLLFPNHPYATPVMGRIPTVQRLTREDLVQFHRRHFRPDQLVIVAIGPMPTEDMVAQVESVLGDWQAPDEDPFQLKLPLEPIECSEILKSVQDTHQSMLMIGYRGAAAVDPDYPVLKVLSTYLGNGLSSRLFVELREKLGLAYEVSSVYATRRDPAPFVAYMGTATENTRLALDRLTAEMKRLLEVKLTTVEIERAKRKVLGQYALGKQTNAQIAQLLGSFEILGLGIDYDKEYPQRIQAVTVDDIYRVAHTYLSTPGLSVVGPAEVLNAL